VFAFQYFTVMLRMWRRDSQVWNLTLLYGLLSAGIAGIALLGNTPRETLAAGPAGAQKNADGTYGPNHVDPVKLNGAIFENWPQPRAVIVITGAQDGYIEPCGCAGLENQKGGMSRRADLLAQLAAKKWPYIAIDTGGLVKGFGAQALLKYEAAVESLRKMGYQVFGFGTPELKFPVDALIGYSASQDDAVCANVGFYEFDDTILKRYRIVDVNGVKIGITAILSAGEFKQLNNKDLKLREPLAALNEVVPLMVKERCQRIIVLTYNSSSAEIESLAKAVPQITDIVTCGNGDIPPLTESLVPGTKTLFLETGHKGMYAIALGIFDDPQQPLRYQRVPLDARFGDNDAIARTFADYQKKLEDIGLQKLVVRAVQHPSGRGLFVGSQECGKCHTQAYKTWLETPHAKAMETLITGTPPRQHDPECISCHATGWEPQKYYPFTGGYQNMKETPHLAGNGCENCHGPGKKHAEAELAAATTPNKTDPKLLAALRSSMRVSRDASGCVQCHDVDNSPEFDFDSYWPSVEHKGKN
jgi:hypothetical protein